MTDSIEKPNNTEKKGGLRGFFKRKKANSNPEQVENSTPELSANTAEPAVQTAPKPVVEAAAVENSLENGLDKVDEKGPDQDLKKTSNSDLLDSKLDESLDEHLDENLDKSLEKNQQQSPESSVEKGLDKSRSSFLSKISNVFKGSFDLDDDLFDELEEVLITSDIGVEASILLVEKLRVRVKSHKIQDAPGVVQGLRDEIAELIKIAEQPWAISKDSQALQSEQTNKPYVMLMVGVNGVGKTTTTAKIAKRLKDQGQSVMLAAADTFRAAAVEQLQEWGQRMDIPVVAQTHGADAAAVAHDALTSAIARNIDILIIDTAGRLHTQTDLMEQLQKVNRVLAKIDPSTPHEVMQILDAGTGQNALSQLDHFQKAVGVSSICLTKLDGSAKGGVAISLTQKHQLPIRFIGLGEGFNDLKPFIANDFAKALIPDLVS